MIPVPTRELESDAVYVMSYEGKIEIVQIVGLDTNDEGIIDSVDYVTLFYNRKGAPGKKNHWEDSKSRPDDVEQVFLQKSSLPKGFKNDKWRKPLFYYPAYLKNTGGGKTKRARRSRRASATRRSSSA